MVIPAHRRVRGRDIVGVAADHQGHPNIGVMRGGGDGVEAFLQIRKALVEGVAFIRAHNCELGVLARPGEGLGFVAEGFVGGVDDREDVKHGFIVGAVECIEDSTDAWEAVDWGVEPDEEKVFEHRDGEGKGEVLVGADPIERLISQVLEDFFESGFDVCLRVVLSVEST